MSVSFLSFNLIKNILTIAFLMNYVYSLHILWKGVWLCGFACMRMCHYFHQNVINDILLTETAEPCVP